MKPTLTPEEKTLLEDFEKGEFVPAPYFAERKKTLIASARQTLRKNKRLNVRISERDLLELQKCAVREGLPYQTYVASILHKFVSGALVENR